MDLLAFLAASGPYDPASPPFDRRHGAPAWAITHDPLRTVGDCVDELADYDYDPASPLPPPPPGPPPTCPPEYSPTSPVFNPPPAGVTDAAAADTPPSACAARRKRPRLILDVLGSDGLPIAPNCDLTSDGVDRMYGFDMCAYKGGLRFLINSSSPSQALSMDHGPLSSVPAAMLESALSLQSTVFVLSTRTAKRGRRVFEEL